YISLVPEDGAVLMHLASGVRGVEAFVRSLPPEKLTTPHAPGEWTVQDILQHIADTERVFSYRALRIARGDKTVLPGFDQDDYAANANANARDLDDLLEEFQAVRRASIALISSFSDELLLRRGSWSGGPLSVRGAVYIITGHPLYHIASIFQNYC
ncbi:MAG TPA: DinB family protein, partial [Dehalococcoidia bacterium]|nr:DinB family protein [Dehalococcoidia bacterium]